MSQSLREPKIENDVESYNARVDREDKVYARFCGTLMVLCLVGAGVAFFMMIREILMGRV